MNNIKLVEIRGKLWNLKKSEFFTDDAQFHGKCDGVEMMN